MSQRLLGGYGLPEELGDHSLADVQVELGYGLFADGRCSHRPPPRSRSWFRVDSVPALEAEDSNPWEDLLHAIGGTSSGVEVILGHNPTGGYELLVGGPDRPSCERLRDRLAPNVSTRDTLPPEPREGWPAVGVVHRVLGTRAEVAPSPTSRSLLDDLSCLSGNWLIHWQVSGIRPQEIDEFSSALLYLADEASSKVTTSTAISANVTSTTVSSGWSRIQSWLEIMFEYSVGGRSTGLWAVATWVAAESADLVELVASTLRTALAPDPKRSFGTSILTCGGPDEAAPSSLLCTGDVGNLLAGPRSGLPGLAVTPMLPTARRPSGSSEPIAIGRYWSTDRPAAISLLDLEGHAFLTGTTGSGKTTSLHRILSEVWNTHRVPFLVIDPVKDEYSDVAGLFRHGLTVVRGADLRLNILEAWPGTDERAHVARVGQAFRGSFTMPSPTPYVLAQLFDVIAIQPGGPGGSSLFDLRDALGPLVESLGYGDEVRSNILASLSTRLNLLLSPLRAHRFSWPDSVMLRGLFEGPTVVTLADIPDDEERAFLVLVIALAAWDRARSAPSKDPVSHVLVLEEAHRVLPELSTSNPADEVGSSAQVSAELLSAMLAEVRSYGLQVIVVDQSPSKVSSNVLRNTNLKIAHRIVHPQDQLEVAAALGLPQRDAALLGALNRGQVVVSTRTEPVPQTIHIVPARSGYPATVLEAPSSVAGWLCCSAQSSSRQIEGHFTAWRAADNSEVAMALFLIGLRIGEGDGKRLRKFVFEQLLDARPTPNTPTDCMAWAGLRRVLIRERRAGLYGSRKAFVATHDRTFSAWSDGLDVDQYAVPSSVGTLEKRCPTCGKACSTRIAGAVLTRGLGQRSLAAALRGPAPTDAVREWARAESKLLEPLLGRSGTDHLVCCQVSGVGMRDLCEELEVGTSRVNEESPGRKPK